MNAARLWEYALGALGRRALSAGEIRQRLHQRAENQADVDGVIAKLREYGYLDDARFAETFAASRRENEAHGRQRVVRDLRLRRVGSADAEQAAGKAFDSTDEVALIEEHLRRKYRGVDLAAKLADPAGLASAYRRLRYAGFSGSNAIRVLRKYSDRAESLEDDPSDAD